MDATCTHCVKDVLIDKLHAVPIEHAQPFLTAVPRVHDVHFGFVVPIGMQRHAQHAGFHAAVVHVDAEHGVVGPRHGINAKHVAFSRGAPQHVVGSPGQFPRNVDSGHKVVFCQHGFFEGPCGLSLKERWQAHQCKTKEKEERRVLHGMVQFLGPKATAPQPGSNPSSVRKPAKGGSGCLSWDGMLTS